MFNYSYFLSIYIFSQYGVRSGRKSGSHSSISDAKRQHSIREENDILGNTIKVKDWLSAKSVEQLQVNNMFCMLLQTRACNNCVRYCFYFLFKNVYCKKRKKLFVLTKLE